MLDMAQIEALRAAPVADRDHLVDGRSFSPTSGQRLDVKTPIDGSVLTTMARGDATDVEAAVSAARRAFADRRWRGLPAARRKAIMARWADLIEAELLELTVLGVRDNGTEIAMAIKAEAASAAATIRYYGEAIDKMSGEIAPTPDNRLGLVHREPVGVVGAIVPWNFPLMIGAWKLAPAIAAGNSVVLKPAETASLALLRLAELAHEAGLPDGVLNVVTGLGGEAGAALAASSDVDVLVFTGSGATGRKLLQASAESNLKRVYLELGGKSPNIVFADAPDLETAAEAAVNAVFRNSGQVCVAGSRLLVERSIHEEFIERLRSRADRMRVGDPLDPETQIGAVNSQSQLHANLKAVAQAQEDGARVIGGGQRLLESSGGYYMQPTIIADVALAHRLFQREVFGPVLAVTTFDGEAEAVALANAGPYGLASGVWTADLARAHRMVMAIKAGVVHVNTYGGTDITVPMGGQKQSGNGYDRSLHALDKFQNLKTAWIAID
ncbi:MAG: aldehyde dehydrogenase family protein [Oricola sp.]|nr:MAG: aldehyde dehydrogenase family protein [Oricola sp.]